MDVPIFSDTRDHQGVMLLVIRPHPDDESIATGGMLA
jgi:LmbE family N-acetylglucosaminyl deacetylase